MSYEKLYVGMVTEYIPACAGPAIRADFVVARSTEEAERMFEKKYERKGMHPSGVKEVKVRGHKITLDKIVKKVAPK